METGVPEASASAGAPAPRPKTKFGAAKRLHGGETDRAEPAVKRPRTRAELRDLAERQPFCVPFSDRARVPDIMRRYGLVVVTDVLRDPGRCDRLIRDMLKYFGQIAGSPDPDKYASDTLEFWDEMAKLVQNGPAKIPDELRVRFPPGSIFSLDDPEYLPPTSGRGLFQCIISNARPLWRLRKNARIAELFRLAYSASGNPGLAADRFVCSCDGVNFQPPGPAARQPRAWPHVDKTVRARENPPFGSSVQAQFVGADTTSGFRATPFSHCDFEKIQELVRGRSKKAPSGDWAKYTGHVDAILEHFPHLREHWQKRIYAPKNSVILWCSELIHDSCAADVPMSDAPGNRAAFFISCQPRRTLNKANMKTRARALYENRGTNHRCSKLVPKNPSGMFGECTTKFCDTIKSLLDDPVRAYELTGYDPRKDPKACALSGVQ